ncbi:NAD(P)H-quinone oxidoreductase [Limnobacter sp.]|uniref:NAD(P)H-quinone oxidoreductase n=1 Tax=Limnobacter sp. TaxID=2003368 RepID=UPI00351306F2
MTDLNHAVPATMQGVVVLEPGGVEQLKLVDLPTPPPGRGEVLIRVHAAGVNRPDVLQRLGLYPPPPDANPRLGLEVAGDIVAVGEGVGQERLGNAVMALCNGGGYSEYVVVPAAQCMSVPPGLTMVQAASLPEVYLTVWQNLVWTGGLKAGAKVLVHGGSSGIGTAAIQLCKRFGAEVFVTVGGPAKASYCEALGAKTYHYKTEVWEDRILADTEGVGVDLVLDMVAGDYLDRDLKCVADQGKIIVIALLGGRFAKIDGARLMAKRAELTGNTLRPRSAQFKARLCAEVEQDLAAGFASGHYKPLVEAVYPLQQVARAHTRMESGESFGKIVLKIGESE